MTDYSETYYGLEKMVQDTEGMKVHLQQALEQLDSNSFKRKFFFRPDKDVREILCKNADFADTFLSDTFQSNMIHRILHTASKHSVPCRFLLLNPLSHQARVRSLMLKAADLQLRGIIPQDEQKIIDKARNWSRHDLSSAERESILSEVLDLTLLRSLIGLRRLSHAKDALQRGATAVNDPEPVTEKGFELSQKLMEELGKFHGRQLLEVRFTSELMLLPAYILGDYCYRGMLMPRASAVRKPWQIYRDDPRTEDDMFSATQQAFNEVWDGAISSSDFETIIRQSIKEREEHDVQQRTLMIAYSEANKQAMDQVQRVLHTINAAQGVKVNVVTFEDVSSASSLTRETVEKALAKAAAGIVLLLPDEQITIAPSPKPPSKRNVSVYRPRPNVLHEMGLMQAKYGFHRVLLLTSSDAVLDLPSNIESTNLKKVDRDVSTGDILRFRDSQLQAAIFSFLNELQVRK